MIPLEGHVGTRHKIKAVNSDFSFPPTVNSYHNYGITPDGLGAELEPLAVDHNGLIEAFRHRRKPLLCMMWHPERESPARLTDTRLFLSLFT